MSAKVRALVADGDHEATFFCGGSRNFPSFIDLFDGVVVLEVDLATLNRRLDERLDSEWGGCNGSWTTLTTELPFRVPTTHGALMSVYELEPEVAGGFGPTTVLDTSVHPPDVSRLGYEFDGWLGDDLVTTFPVYVVTDRLRTALEASGVTGIEFDHVDVTTSEEFRDVFPDLELPTWHWMQVTGVAGQADAWPGRKARLTVSQRFMDVLAGFSLEMCDVTADPA